MSCFSIALRLALNKSVVDSCSKYSVFSLWVKMSRFPIVLRLDLNEFGVDS